MADKRSDLAFAAFFSGGKSGGGGGGSVTPASIVTATGAMTTEQKAQTRENIGAGEPLTPAQIAEGAGAWLENNLATPSTPPIDSTLSVANAAADAKATGDAIGEVKSALDEAIEDFAVPTQEAVDNWLDAHPEATTTVQDGSLTEAKFADSLKLKTIKDYVTPEMFGAKGDGITDDTSAVSEMFAYAATNGVAACINNKYAITQKMVIETPITMNGSGRFIYSGNETTGYVFTFGKESAATAYWDIKIRLTNANQNLYGINGIRVVNSLHGTFDVCSTFFADGFTLDGYTKDCDYNLVYPKYISSNLRNIVLTASDNGAVNQNTFVGGSCRIDSNIAPLIHEGDVFYDLYIKSTGTNKPNNNTFVGVSFESVGTAKNRVYSSAHGTLFLNCRYEGVSIYEDSDTLGSRYIDGFNMYGAIESLHASSQYMARDKQYLNTTGYTNKLKNNEDKFVVINSSDLTAFSISGTGDVYIRNTLLVGNEIALHNTHNTRTKLTTGDTVPSYSSGWYSSVHLNSNASATGRRAVIRDGSAWENLLYTYAKGSTERPESVRIGYMMFDTTLNKPIWYKGNSEWVDSTGTVV